MAAGLLPLLAKALNSGVRKAGCRKPRVPSFALSRILH